MRTIGDQPLEAPPACLRALGAVAPEGRDPPIAGWLSLEEIPGPLLRLESGERSGVERGLVARLERVKASPLRVARGERREAGAGHAPRTLEPRGLARVDVAPDAARAARRAPVHEGVGIDALLQPVDPAEAHGLVDRLEVGKPLAPGVSLVERHPQLRRLAVVRLEPAPEMRRRSEE